MLSKRYRLPETPHILVHPSSSARKGDFTCSTTSLSIMLDYRPVDTTKHCFELSLFAEQFNEMLLRDFGYNIFKAVYHLPADFDTDEAKEAEKERDGKRDRKSKADDDEPKEKKSKKDDEADAAGKSGGRDDVESVSSDKRSGDGDKDKDRKSSRRNDDRDRRVSRRDDESDADDHSVRSDAKRRDRTKMITVNPYLLLSFVYFDQTHCGYIMTTHIEELFYSLGLKLTRADIKSLKGLPRWLFYR